jgi:hypothetical protein
VCIAHLPSVHLKPPWSWLQFEPAPVGAAILARGDWNSFPILCLCGSVSLCTRLKARKPVQQKHPCVGGLWAILLEMAARQKKPCKQRLQPLALLLAQTANLDGRQETQFGTSRVLSGRVHAAVLQPSANMTESVFALERRHSRHRWFYPP